MPTRESRRPALPERGVRLVHRPSHAVRSWPPLARPSRLVRSDAKPEGTAAARTQVLLVDDEEDILTTMRDVVNFLMPDVDVITARSASQALEALAANAGIMALMTGYRMGGMDGLELAEAVHKQQPGLPVVLVTAFAGQETRELAARWGAFSFLAKPFNAADLVEALCAALASRQAPSLPGNLLDLPG